jgi:hypothetical protein
VPSLLHHVMVDLFREQPELAAALLADAAGAELPRFVGARVGESSLDHLRPVERRADLVVELTGRRGAPELAIVVEVQRRIDRRKPLEWATYMVVLRRCCEACVLVVAPDARVAAWAARPFRLGPGNEALRVWVLGPEQLPRITGPRTARRRPGLALLSALAHGERDEAVLKATAAALSSLDDTTAEVYCTALNQHLRAPVRALLAEFCMDLKKYENYPRPAWLVRLKVKAAAEGRREGRAKGREEGRRVGLREGLREGRRAGRREGREEGREEGLLEGHEEGLHEGELTARRSILLRLLERFGPVGVTHQRRVAACDDLAELDRWIDRAVTAQSVRQVFARPR